MLNVKLLKTAAAAATRILCTTQTDSNEITMPTASKHPSVTFDGDEVTGLVEIGSDYSVPIERASCDDYARKPQTGMALNYEPCNVCLQ